MFVQLLTLLIILLFAYSLYRFTRSDLYRRGGIKGYRPELDFQIGRSVHLNRGLQGKSDVLRKAASRLPIISLAFFGVLTTAHAQQTIFNVPSTDVLPPGKVYFELDTTYKFTDAEALTSFYSFVPRVVVGAGKRMEMGLNINGNIQPGSDATTLSPTFKWKAYDGADNGWAFVVGDNIFIPVRNRSYDLGNYLYAEISKTLKTKTRLTGGGYYFTPNVVAPNANRAGGQFAIEQPITSYLTLQADWFTGKTLAGYFTPGGYFKPHPKVTVYIGYSIGNVNVSRGNHFFYSAIGINLN